MFPHLALAATVAVTLPAQAASVLVPTAAANVPGKEWTTRDNRDSTGVPTPEQTLKWVGNANSDGFYFGGTRNSQHEANIDALANRGDAYFSEVVRDAAALLVATSGDTSIRYHTPSTGGVGTWATPPAVGGVQRAIDSLEVWGPSRRPDADRYSLRGDTEAVRGHRVSVWGYNSRNDRSRPLVYADQIARAIGLESRLLPLLDLDALMFNTVFGPQRTRGFELLFSIAPIIDPLTGLSVFDGGEIWHWKSSDDLASFLVHGGRVWNTALDVAGLFGGSEDIVALEAVPVFGTFTPEVLPSVPTPPAYLTMIAGLWVLGGIGWRRARRLH